jgi:hypothetical protein
VEDVTAHKRANGQPPIPSSIDLASRIPPPAPSDAIVFSSRSIAETTVQRAIRRAIVLKL